MPTNPHHQQSFGTFEGISSADQLRLYFQLTDFDRALIDEMRSATTKLGFAVQLSSVRFLGTFPTNLQQVPAEVIDYLAKRAAIRDLSREALLRLIKPFEAALSTAALALRYNSSALSAPAVLACSKRLTAVRIVLN